MIRQIVTIFRASDEPSQPPRHAKCKQPDSAEPDVLEGDDFAVRLVRLLEIPLRHAFVGKLDVAGGQILVFDGADTPCFSAPYHGGFKIRLDWHENAVFCGIDEYRKHGLAQQYW